MQIIIFTVLALISFIAAATPQQKNIATVVEIYANIVSGNTAAILTKFAPTYTAQVQSAAQVLPYYANYDNDYAGELAALHSLFTLNSLDVVSTTATGNVVSALIQVEETSIFTGKVLTMYRSGFWTFNKAGLVTGVLTLVDTAAQIDAATLGQTPYSNMVLATELIATRDSSLTALAALYSPDCVFELSPGGTVDLTTFIAGLAALDASIPDYTATILSLVADDNTVTIYRSNTGTFTGAPYQGIQPNGKPISYNQMSQNTIKDGLIVESFIVKDYQTLFSQLQA